MSFAIVGGVLTVGGGLFGMGSAKRAARDAKIEKDKQQRELSRLENSRQAIINPFSGAKNLSSMASDLSGSISNPFSSLGVATQAAEIQMEQSDIALANTLDTLRSTGASAGGATALAQAALQSKKGVAANIEQQEARNEELKARGQQQLDQIKMSEQQRLQNVSISEGQRLQTTDAAGKQFVFEQQENRTNADLDRASGQERQAQQNIASANAAKSSAIAGGFSALGSMAGAVVGAGGIKK